jgi:hypothetical protein
MNVSTGNVIVGAQALRNNELIGLLRTSPNPDDRRLSSDRWIVAGQFTEVSVTDSTNETTARFLTIFHTGTGLSLLVDAARARH